MEQLNRLMSVGVAIAVAVTVALYQPKASPPPNDAWFKSTVLESPQPVVVKFGAEWCGPCRSMDEALHELRPKLSHKAKFLIVDIDRNPELFDHYKSGGGIPQVMIFSNGSVVAHEHGFGGTERLESWIKGNL